LFNPSYHGPGLNITPVVAAAAQARRKMKKVIADPWLKSAANGFKKRTPRRAKSLP
jgi:hypothetical protein